MADLDNLQIQIKASSSDAVSAVDKLIGALERLNSSLNNYKAGSQYAQGMESLASGLERVSKAVNSIDDGKMKRLSSALSSLNKAGGNLSIGQSVNKEMSIAERRIDAFTKKFIAFSEATKGLEGNSSASRSLSNEDLGISQIQQASQVNTNALQQVAQGLQAIQSVGQLPDFSGIGVLARNINKLGAENASTLATSLPEIASGLKAFSGLDIPNFPNLEGFAKGLKELRGMGAKSASEASDILPKIAMSLRDFQGLTVPNLEGIESFSKALRSLGSGNIVNASTSLKPIADGLRELSDIQINTNVEQLTAFAKVINSLGKENTATAIENLPRLAQAFNELVNAINQGNISERTASFAQSLAQLTKNSGSATVGMQRVGQQALNWNNLFEMLGAKTRQFVNGGLRLLANYLRSIGGLFVNAGQKVGQFALSLLGIKKHSEESATSLMSLARAIGRFWASMFWVINGIRGLWKSVESSMDYIETLNYFKASFRQVSETAVGNWQKLGYESAEAYANSFEKRTKQLTSKMTGFDIKDNGELGLSGGKSLGLNPNTLMQYQAQFAQMASSMGASANNATLLSQALTEIGADLASVKNMKFEDVWQDMASGMVGMSRTLDKYGVNIRKSAMNQKLLELGIDATADKLSGADKAMLRTIILLDSTKYAWGDLANTINQPANQLRLLTANLQSCARMLGNLFLPLISKVLPYLNAMAIAVQRLLMYLGKLLGIDLGKITSGVGGSNEAISDLLDDAENVDGALDDASESAKKLKNNLLGVDELNIVSDNLTSADANGNMSSLLDDAFLDALSDYQSAWDKAFEAMENRAKELADKIVQFFKDLFRPISEAWARVGQDVKEAWAKAFKSLGELIKTIFKDAWDVWQSPLTTEIFVNLFNILKDIGLIISNLADNFRKAWEEGGRGKAILEAIWKIVWAISENAREVADYFVEWSKNLNFAPVLESTKNFLEAIARNAKDIIGIFADWYKIVWGGIGKYLIEEFFPSVLNSLTKMVDLIDWGKLRADISGIYESLVELAKLVGGVLLTAFDKLAETLGNSINPFIERLSGSFKNLVDDLKNAKDVNDVINAIFNFGDDRAVDLGKLIHFISENINKALDSIDFKNVGRRIAGMINKFLAEVNVNELAHTIAGLVNGLFDVALGFIAKLDWFKIGQAIGDALRQIDWLKIIQGIFELIWGLLKGWLGSLGSAPLETILLTLFGAGSAVSAVTKALTGEGLFTTIFKKLFGLDDVSKYKKAFSSALDIDGESGAFDRLKASAEGASGAKNGFRIANEKLGAGAEQSAGKIAGEMTALDKLKLVAGTIAKEIAGIALVAGGSYLGISNFLKQLEGGFNWAQEALMLLGTAMATVGAILMGAPATVAVAIGAIVATVATAIVLIKEHWEEIKAWVAGLGEWLQTHIGEPVRIFFTETIPNAFSAFGEWISGVVQSVGEKLGAFRDKVHEISESVKTKIAENAQAVGQWIADIAQKVGEFFVNLWQGITEWLGKIWNSITTFFTNIWEKIVAFFSNIWTTVTEFFANLWGTLTSFVANVWESIRSLAESIWNAIKGVVDAILGWIAELWESVKSFFGNVVSAIAEFIRNAWQKITTFLAETWQSIKKFFSDVWEGLVKFVSDTFAKIKTFFEETWEKIKNFFRDTIQHIKEKFNEIIEKVKTFFGDIWQKIKDFFVNAWETISSKIKEIITGAWNLIKDIPKKLWDFGKNALAGFIDGFKSKVADAWNAVKEFGGGVVDKIKEVLRIGSPSKEFRDIAIYSLQGYEEGVDSEKKNALSELSEFAKESIQQFDGIDKQFNDIGMNAGKSLAEGIKSGTAMAMDSVKSMAMQMLNFVKDSMQQVHIIVMQAINNLNIALNDLMIRMQSIQASIASMGGMPVSYGNVMDYFDENGRRYFASGGFPEDGWFRASHGEIMGRFDNGKSVVANNDQITDGIAKAVYSAMMDAGVGSGGREEALLEELIQAVRSGQHITIDGRELVNAYDNRKARNGYAFT